MHTPNHAFCFFFKQKTAYEISTRDWSSDVCSSDLRFLLSKACSTAPNASTLRHKSILLRWPHAKRRGKSRRRCSSSGGQTRPFPSSTLFEAVRRCRDRSSRNSHDQPASLRWVRVHRQTMSKELLLREGSGA